MAAEGERYPSEVANVHNPSTWEAEAGELHTQGQTGYVRRCQFRESEVSSS